MEGQTYEHRPAVLIEVPTITIKIVNLYLHTAIVLPVLTLLKFGGPDSAVSGTKDTLERQLPFYT